LPQGRIEPCSEKRRQGAQLFILRPGGRRRRGVRGWASRTHHLELDGIGTPQASCMTSRIRQKGMEPAIVGFRRARLLYSAESADLHRIWEGDRRGSNPRPSEPQSDALPTELRPPRAGRILPAKGRLANVIRGAYGRVQSPQPRNSVFLSLRFPSSTMRKTLEGLGVLMITTFPFTS
jgi:hypothetical protein